MANQVVGKNIMIQMAQCPAEAPIVMGIVF